VGPRAGLENLVPPGFDPWTVQLLSITNINYRYSTQYMSFSACNKNVVYLLSAEVIVSPPSLSLFFWFDLFRIETFNTGS
jgi:hypothetical protein